ncbi:MAG: glycoside hydrolase family 3 C-terminal domain-containing protein [Burkholderiales bacterium]|nr:glycoside hydrolase family 3 C-terminal domain-containing protein [Burkholderiales bacterium]
MTRGLLACGASLALLAPALSALAHDDAAAAGAEASADAHTARGGPGQEGRAAAVRAAALVAKMTLDEKIQMVHGWSVCGIGFTALGSGLNGPGFIPGIPRLGIPDINYTDGGAGIADCSSQSLPFHPRANPAATALPAPLALAATWDRHLAYDYGALLAREARDQGFSMVLGGSIGLTRDPRAGRGFEFMGEDPLLSGEMVASKIRGAQDGHVVISLKHFAANQQETDRGTSNSVIDERTLRELYLRHFEIAVKQAQPGSVMCSYNKLNGDWACENDWLLNKVLKTDWGFAGFVQSDWGATHSTVKAALAGLDEEEYAPTYFGSALKAAVTAGSVPMSRLDDMVQRKLQAFIASGVFDHPAQVQPIDFTAGAALAQKVASESTVLLKNNGVLPLSRSVARVALIGRYADRGMLTGGGSSQVISPGGPAVVINPDPAKPPCPTQPGPGNWCEIWLRSVPLDALRAALPQSQVNFADGSDPAAAAALAAQSDVAIVLADEWATEGSDLATLTLRRNQDALIAAVAAANPRTVVVLESGNPMLMPWLGSVGAVLQNWYAGIRGAQALAAILVGDVNPSGKLPVTFPAQLADLPTGGGAFLAGDVPYSEGLDVGYRWYDAKGIAPLFPFGHGLSYTHFDYSQMEVSANGRSVRFRLRNSGGVAGAEVAQVYAGLPATAGEPPKRLIAWKRVELAPGESRNVELEIPRPNLAIWDSASGAWKVEPGAYQVYVGSSSRDIRLQRSIVLR